MKFLLITLFLLTMLKSSVIEKNRNDITSKADGITKTPKRHSERVLNDINDKLKKILAQRSEIYKTERNLNLDPNKHVDLVLAAKDKMLKFRWKNGKFNFGADPSTYRTVDGKIKVMVALENRFPPREVQKNQMQCTLHMKNHGMNFNKRKRVSRFRVDFRSNCFRNTFTKYFIGTGMYKNPIGVKINLDFVNIKYMFKNIATNYNFTYYFLPIYYATVKKGPPRPYTEQSPEIAHTRKLKNRKLKLKNEKKHGKKKHRKLFFKKLHGFAKRLNIFGHNRNSKRVLFDKRYTYKSSKYSFDIVVNVAQEAHFTYDTLRRIWDSSNTVKCSRYDVPSPHIFQLYRKQPIGMKCGI